MNLKTLLAAVLLVFAPLVAPAQTYPPPTLPLTGAEVTPCIQNGGYKACTVSNITGSVAPSGTPGNCVDFATSSTLGDAGGPCALTTVTNTFSLNQNFTLGLTLQNLTSGGAQCLEANSSGVVVGTGAICGGSGSVPGGSNTQIQYNNGGAFGGVAGFTWNGTTLTLPNTTTLPGGGTFTSTTNTFTKPVTFNGADTFNATMTLPDTGTLASGINTFVKPVTDQNSATTPGFPAYTWSGQTSSFGCLYSSTTATLDIGTTSAAGGTCSNSVFEFTTTTALLQKATTINPSGSVVPLTVQSGGTNIVTFSDTGSVPRWIIPTSVFLQNSNNSGTFCADTSAIWDFGTGTTCNTNGTASMGVLDVATTINGPSGGGGIQADLWNTTTFRLGQPITLIAGNQYTTVTSGQGLIGQDNVTPGAGVFMRGAGGLQGQGPQSIFSPYMNTYELSIIGNGGGASGPRPAIGIESGVQQIAVEIGTTAMAANMTQTNQLLFADQIAPAGSIQHYTVTAGGTGYTTGTVSATLSGGGCTTYPTLLVTVLSGAVTAIGSQNGNLGAGCTSPPAVTISDSGVGAGAIATAAIVTGTTDATLGPFLLFRGAPSATGALNKFAGFGPATLAANNDDQRFAATSGGWGFSFDGTAAGTQPYLRMPGGIVFERPNGATHNGTFSAGEALGDCDNQTAGTSNNVLCLTTTEGGTTGAGLKLQDMILTPLTVATLPGSPVDGMRAYVTDADACTFASAVTHTVGTTHCPVYYDGGSSSWKAG